MKKAKEYEPWQKYIQNFVEKEAARRKNAKINHLIIIAGEEAPVTMDLRLRSQIQLRVQPHIDLVRVCTRQSDGELLLAVYSLPDLTELDEQMNDEPSVITLEGGQEIAFNCAPHRNRCGELCAVSVFVSYRETRMIRAAILRFKQLGHMSGSGMWLVAAVFGLFILFLCYLGQPLKNRFLGSSPPTAVIPADRIQTAPRVSTSDPDPRERSESKQAPQSGPSSGSKQVIKPQSSIPTVERKP
jgi:hypothetical protein